MIVETETLLTFAREEAQHYHHKYIRTEHLLLALLRMADDSLIDMWGLNPHRLKKAVGGLNCPICAAEEKMELSAGASRALDTAKSLAGDGVLHPNHVLRGIIQLSPTVRNLMLSCDINPMRLMHQLENDLEHG